MVSRTEPRTVPPFSRLQISTVFARSDKLTAAKVEVNEPVEAVEGISNLVSVVSAGLTTF